MKPKHDEILPQQPSMKGGGMAMGPELRITMRLRCHPVHLFTKEASGKIEGICPCNGKTGVSHLTKHFEAAFVSWNTLHVRNIPHITSLDINNESGDLSSQRCQ